MGSCTRRGEPGHVGRFLPLMPLAQAMTTRVKMIVLASFILIELKIYFEIDKMKHGRLFCIEFQIKIFKNLIN